MKKWLLHIIVTGLSLLLADWLLPQVSLNGYLPVLIAAVILGLINAVIRPILVLLTLPVTLITLGLFLLVINAITYWLTAYLVAGFEVRGFVGAFLGALVTVVFRWVVGNFIPKYK